LNSIRYNQNVSDSLFAASVSYDPNRPPTKKWCRSLTRGNAARLD